MDQELQSDRELLEMMSKLVPLNNVVDLVLSTLSSAKPKDEDDPDEIYYMQEACQFAREWLNNIKTAEEPQITVQQLGAISHICTNVPAYSRDFTIIFNKLNLNTDLIMLEFLKQLQADNIEDFEEDLHGEITQYMKGVSAFNEMWIVELTNLQTVLATMIFPPLSKNAKRKLKREGKLTPHEKNVKTVNSITALIRYLFFTILED